MKSRLRSRCACSRCLLATNESTNRTFQAIQKLKEVQGDGQSQVQSRHLSAPDALSAFGLGNDSKLSIVPEGKPSETKGLDFRRIRRATLQLKDKIRPEHHHGENEH